ncbi:uncharacterized protein [Anabrus simplex]|uniref:uncharacterized protein isoform X2 n=1 Tax=Anabrus simplex TaxID=316456 RepID=UPI0034DCECE9
MLGWHHEGHPVVKQGQIHIYDTVRSCNSTRVCAILTDIQRLSELQIPLTFPVPESHQIETYISHEPTQKQQDRFNNLDISMKKGKFNPDEDDVIRKNWERFSKEFHFDDPRPFILMSYNWKKYMKHEERIHFVQYLGRGLPNRYLHGIYRRFKILFAPRNIVNKRYEETIDKIILECKARGIKDPFSKLASVTGRNRHSLYKRHCVLLRKKNFKGKDHIEWTKDIAETVIKKLMKICEITDIEELRGQTISWSTWKLVAEECQYHAEAVKSFWDKKLSTQIFATKPIFQREILSEIVEKLIKLEVKHWQDVNWQELSKDFYGASPLFLFRRICRFKERVPKEKWATLKDYLLYLQTNMSKLRIPSAVLQRYSVSEDGTLTLIDDTGKFILDSDSDSDK